MIEQRIRVVVANRPRLLRELVLTTISEQPDIEIVGIAEREEEILRIVEQMQPDFLILALGNSGERPAICESVFERRPQLKTLAIAPESQQGIVVLGGSRHSLPPGGKLEEGILQALRSGSLAGGGS